MAIKQRTLCATCKRAREKLLNPVGYTFDNFKQNAKRRGIKFLLTLKDFVDFLQDNPRYMVEKGRGPNDLTIDRKVPRLGYVKGNIQVMPNGDNVKKRNEDIKKYGWSVQVDREGAPF